VFCSWFFVDRMWWNAWQRWIADSHDSGDKNDGGCL
jgi:hypothetical protein